MLRSLRAKMLESRLRKLESHKDRILAELMRDDRKLFRHEYPNTPVLEDLFLEADYLRAELALCGRAIAYPNGGLPA
jgi:hypothetical protein